MVQQGKLLRREAVQEAELVLMDSCLPTIRTEPVMAVSRVRVMPLPWDREAQKRPGGCGRLSLDDVSLLQLMLNNVGRWA